MKTRLLSAIVTAAILLTMLSCHEPEINPDETDTANIVTERITDTETTAPIVTEPMTAATETEPITEAPTPETTAPPETETETPVDTEVPPREPVLDIDNLPPDIPAPKLFAGMIQRPMMYKAIGTSSTFYCTGITGTPYSRNIPIHSEEYNSLVKGWYTFSPDSDEPMKPLEITEHTVSLTLGEETLTALYSTYQIGNKHYTVRPVPATQGSEIPEEHLQGSIPATWRENPNRSSSALSVFLTDARYIYCSLITNSVEDIVIYDTVAQTWASLRERAEPTARRYETLQKTNVHNNGTNSSAILLQAQFKIVSPHNDRFLYCVSDNNDPKSTGGTYFVYDLNTGTSTLVCNESWEGTPMSHDEEGYGWLDNDTLYIMPKTKRQTTPYEPCYLIRYQNGAWDSNIVSDHIWQNPVVNIGADIYIAEFANDARNYRNAETGQPVSDTLNTFLNSSYPLHILYWLNSNFRVHPDFAVLHHYDGRFTFLDLTTEQTDTVTDVALAYDDSIRITDMFLTPDGILLNLETRAERNCYIYYLPYAYLEYLRS